MRRYLESAVIFLVIGALSLVLFNALNAARDDMEEASVQGALQSMRTQLMEVMAHRETAGGALPTSDNPLDWITARPANYLGAVDTPPEQKSIWYYDKRTHTLIYVYRDGRLAHFQLSRTARAAGVRGVMSGIGLVRVAPAGA